MNKKEIFRYNNPLTTRANCNTLTTRYHQSKGYKKWHFEEKSSEEMDGRFTVWIKEYFHRDQCFAKARITFDKSEWKKDARRLENIDTDTLVEFEWMVDLEEDYGNWDG